ncbi:conserved hypothetical protein [Histoplasma mississippiense (nom. inval.)]|uniref:conserved hypothetical protein n=1 Tax=Ajellomyces capsulatus (strain NAm1 / WU24) TaxID=2059318 RepID=UPI000157B780|nr:conserved hypothetical protein [Histoplasma mississippiense (nom. inval.)]EDN04108.1 conserved hypothetical protein [Histoplasma mississippiense (nom. inval.)]
MDALPPDYVDHNLPLILLSGLGSDPEANSQDGITPDDGVEYPQLREGGVEIFSDFPLLTDSTAERVLNALLSQDATHRPWNARAGDVGYKIKRVGRTYTLPPRKGPVLPRSPLSSSVSGAPSNTAASPIVLHSPISPLTPSSPTFPDGIMTPQWVTKHQALIPAAFINFFPFTTDTNMASLGDNQLKIEINSLRKKWAASGYKTRFIVALLCDDGPLPEDANDRIAGIRMATNLDMKSIFVVQPEPSQLDISEFIKALFANLRGPSVEYYRDLSKHARRKKNRGTIPPPTAPPTSGTSQTLSLQGWNVRYDFKLGVFAEFRQEMDAACRSYEAAYEGLFGEEVFEMIAGWNPRRQLAENIPDEDRVAPTQPTGPSSLSRATVYDNYLAPEPYDEYPMSDHPGFAHSKLILGFLESSTEEFSKRQQNRIVEQLRLKMAKEHIRIGQWKDGLALIQPLWLQLSWRREGWWGLMEDFAWTLRECAIQAEDRETVLRVDWELMNHIVILKGEDSVSCLAASFVFAKSEGNVGEPLQSQLVIRSCAHAGSSPIRLTEVKVAFEGNIRPIKLLASENESSSSSSGCEIVPVSLQDSVNLDASTVQSPTAGLPQMVGATNLSFGPKQTRAFNLVSVPREPGEAQVASITLRIEQENFDLSCVISEQNRDESVWWRMGKQGPIARRTGKDRDTSVSRILPKPPKVRISTPRSRNHYYTDEKVVLDVQIDNDEDEAAEVDVEIKLFGYTETSATFSWINETASDSIAAEDASPSSLDTPIEGGSSTLSKRRTVGTLACGASRTLSILFTNTTLPLDYEVEISAFYHLVSDVETKIFKTVSLDLSFIRPFEANYEFLPRIHPAPWPDFFHYDDSPSEDSEEQEQKHNGLQQLWCLNSKIVSFALEPLIIEEVNVSLLGITAGNICRIGTETLKSPEAPTIGPEGLRESEFTMEIQRLALNNRQPSTLNLALDIRWRRPDDDNNDQQSSSSSQSTISTLPIPRFLVPLVEPRVLAHTTPSTTLPGFLHLDYTLENPSMHFLTFNITMEASDQFAFHGPKATTLQLVPLSRHTVRYNLLANVRGKWIQPQLAVVDSYFNKTLRVLPTEGMMGDKKGILVWVDADG